MEVSAGSHSHFLDYLPLDGTILSQNAERANAYVCGRGFGGGGGGLLADVSIGDVDEVIVQNVPKLPLNQSLTLARLQCQDLLYLRERSIASSRRRQLVWVL